MDGNDVANLLTRRNRAVAKHDEALARWPDRAGPDFRSQLMIVVRELSALVQSEEQNVDLVERSRTWRYLGDALFDLAIGREKHYLRQGVEAYERAEALLDGMNQRLDEAKLNFNFANTLRGLSEGLDSKLLTEAELRYLLALSTFQREAPQFVPALQAALSMLKTQRSLLQLHEQSATALTEVQRLAGSLTQVDDLPKTEREARKLLADLKARRLGPAKLAERALESLYEGLPAVGPGASAAITHAIDVLCRLAEEGRGRPMNPFSSILEMLLARYRSEVNSGRVSPERQRALEPLLKKLAELVQAPGEEVAELMRTTGAIRELMAQLIPLLDRPSEATRQEPDGARAAWLRARVGDLAKFTGAESTRAQQSSGERTTAQELFVRLAEVQGAVAGTDEKVLKLEQDVVRPLAYEIERFALRHHLTLAHPYWTSPRLPSESSLVFFSGIAEVASLVDQACRTRQLSMYEAGPGREAGQAQWDGLWRSRLAVFDLSVTEAAELASISYALGLAKALGRKSLVLQRQGNAIPFNVEIDPVYLRGDGSDARTIGEGIDLALYTSPARQWDSSIEATISFVEHRFANAAANVRHTAELVKEAADDAIEVRHRLETLLGFLGTKAPQILLPAWPGKYPDDNRKRLFHVTPYTEPWSQRLRDIAEAACKSQSAEYVRGDEVADPAIIRSIWDEICSASHVLVDLTGFSANVALELGLAHGIGRRCLVIAQEEDVKKLFPAVRHLRVTYSLDRKGEQVRRAISEFVSSAS